MKYFFLFISIFFFSPPFSLISSVQEEQLTGKIQAHLTLRDYPSAIKEAQQSLIIYPNSLLIQESHIQALAKAGEEKKLLQAWDHYIEQFPEKIKNRELIEEMAWGILQKASGSSSIIMREMALLAAFFSQDSKGVAVLHQGMQDANYAIRKMAVKLAAHFRDHKLIEEVKRLFSQEKVWGVRQQVLKAIGKMKIVDLKPDLESLIASSDCHVEEKTLAMEALLELFEEIERSKIEYFAQHHKSNMRQLACQAIAYFQSGSDLDLLISLAQDPQAEVRFEAFQAIGQIRPSKDIDTLLNLARKSVQDINYQVALSAAWLLTLYSPVEGQQWLDQFLNHPRREVRLLAAAVLSVTGSYGVPLMLKHYHIHSDTYVRLNLILGLINQRQAVQTAAEDLKHILLMNKEKWMTLKIGLFNPIINQSVKIQRNTTVITEDDSHLLHLELLNLLAILKVPQTQETIRSYLSERSLEISTIASALLLTEGDESAIELVKELLQDTQPHVRLQAAFILSLWSREESSIHVLQELYPTSSWDRKSKILEGLGRIGSADSIPFLINVLKEPSQTLRLIAAMSIIQCLNH